jgi:hypothetical protein
VRFPPGFPRLLLDLSVVWLVALQVSCPKKTALEDQNLAEARRLLRAPRGDLATVTSAFERFQTAAAAAPEGPFAGEAAYALGLLALDLHLVSLPPFGSIPGWHAQLQTFLERARVPAAALLLFAQKVFAVARDRTRGHERDRAERALELAALRERVRELLEEMERERGGAPRAPPIQRQAILSALEEQHSRMVRLAGARELVERTVILQRVTTLALLRHIEDGDGCPVLAHLAKELLGKTVDADRPLSECQHAVAGSASATRARLVRLAWVKLEEFALDRPQSPFEPLVRRLLEHAPVEAHRASRPATAP